MLPARHHGHGMHCLQPWSALLCVLTLWPFAWLLPAFVQKDRGRFMLVACPQHLFVWRSPGGKTINKSLTMGPKLFHYITLLFRMSFSDYVLILCIAELVLNYFLGYVIFLRCCKAYQVDIGLHHILVFELIYRTCNLFYITVLV